ncbi:hypothetical protein GGS26DRAFT_581315 [Hypomontagnella submonticulosa]|nr:hypothetical protein GGS26DRAFT_581315 [Hypomontagnella submonticulosa]
MLKACIAAAALGRLAAASTQYASTPLLSTRDTSLAGTNSSGNLPCDALIDAGLGDRLLFANNPAYEPHVLSWYAATNQLRPYCFVLPQSTEEVSTALTALVQANDGAGDWHIALRSGGHGFANNIASGVTIDLTMMNSSSYDSEANVVKIQPGGRWRNVYADLEKFGVTATGGRDGDVGVGGFLLGGGNSFFSGRMGFGCDSVVNFEVVLANGTIINANSTANEGLWRALRGGTGNFGIVTRFDMEAIPSRDLYYDLRYLNVSHSEDVIDAVVGYANQDQSLSDNALVTFFAHNVSAMPETYIGTINVNTKGNGNASTAFDKVKTLPTIYKATTFESMAKAAQGSQLPGGFRGASTTLTFHNDPQILRRCVELHEDLIQRLKTSIGEENFTTMLFFQPIPSYMGEIAKQRGGDMLGLDAIKHNAILWTAGAAVNTDEALAIALYETNVMTAQVKEFAKSVNGDLDFIYLNYADASQDPLGSYGAANIQHMRDMAAQYDPTEVFQKRVPGGFKISRCDSCKTRKTKCDRRSPCSCCVTLNIACRVTRRTTEKRQRVLLSSKYDEAVQDVSRQLSDVKEMLQALMLTKDPGSSSTVASSEPTHSTPPPIIDEQVPSLSSAHEGYNGDSSFQSHAHRVKNALEATLAASELIDVEALDTTTTLSPHKVAERLRDVNKPYDIALDRVSLKPPPQPYDLDFGNMPLPPVDIILRLLRLAKVHKQRFFVDIPLFEEDEFIDMCRGVYFATEPISLWTWICVNVGLYYLILGMTEEDCGRLATTVEAMRSYCPLLKANAEAAMQSLRLCSEPSTESCRALAVLVSMLLSAAARASLDLGLHRLPSHVDSEDIYHKTRIFWHIYCWEKGLSMTCGRTPVIHHYDVTTHHPAVYRDRNSATAPERVYLAFLDYAILTGEIQKTLFSASALRISPQDRIQHAWQFASKLKEIRESVKDANQEDPTWNDMFNAAAMLVDIMTYSLLTIVYRILPPSSAQSHPLQCSDECVDSARMALSRLVKIGEDRIQTDLVGWSMLLNIILSLVPFVPFIVLAGNAIATSSSTDLALLSSVVSVLAPTAPNCPTTQKIHDACEKLGRIASLVVSTANRGPLNPEECPQPPRNDLPLEDLSGLPDRATQFPIDYGFPMAQQDWDSVMNGFESELGGYDSRALTNIIEPYIHTGW